jgi:hypothetical protein
MPHDQDIAALSQSTNQFVLGCVCPAMAATAVVSIARPMDTAMCIKGPRERRDIVNAVIRYSILVSATWALARSRAMRVTDAVRLRVAVRPATLADASTLQPPRA